MSNKTQDAVAEAFGLKDSGYDGMSFNFFDESTLNIMFNFKMSVDQFKKIIADAESE